MSKRMVASVAATLSGDYVTQQWLLHTALKGEGRVSFNAAWILVASGKAVETLICDNSAAVVRFLLYGSYEDGLCRLLLTLLKGIPYVDDEWEAALFDFCLARIARNDTAAAIRTLCVKIAVKIAGRYPGLMQELRATLEMQDMLSMPASVKNVCLKTEQLTD